MMKYTDYRFLMTIILLSGARCLILRLPCLTIADFIVYKQEYALLGHTLQSHKNVDDIGCTVKCAEHPKCRSYNINPTAKLCDLNGKTIGDQGANELTQRSGWIYKSTDYNQTLNGPTCTALSPCKPGILCRDTCESPYYECVECKDGYYGLHCQLHEPIDGQWGNWGSFGECSKLCEGGEQKRYRKCNNPTPAFDGANCQNHSIESRPCNPGVCPDFSKCYGQETSPTRETNAIKTMLYMTNFKIECPKNNGALRQFRFGRQFINGSNHNIFRYKCCDFKANFSKNEAKYTTFQPIGDNNPHQISQHNINCGSTGFISDMQLVTSPDNQKVRYDFTCSEPVDQYWMSQADCYSGDSGWNADGGGDYRYFDRHNVKCNEGYAFTRVQLMTKPSNKNKWRFDFQCCKILYP